MTTDLGSCCGCGKTDKTVRNVIMLDRKAPEPGKGWGCVVCNLPPDGASVILCDECLEKKPQPLDKIVMGYPGENRRIHATAYRFVEFKHDEFLHWVDQMKDAEISF